MKFWHISKWILPGFLCLVLICSGTAAAEAVDAKTVEQLKQMIELQQAQIEAQAKAIEALRKQVEALAESPAAPPETAEAPKGLVRSGGDKVSVKLYGQVNRGVLFVDDGDQSNTYHVDNDNSSTRIGILGDAKVTDDLSVGTKIEVQFESNSSSSMSQLADRNVGPDNFTQRHLDLFFKSNRWGKLSMGQGDTASNNTSEVDLSGTAVIGYSDVELMAGGMFFYDQGVLSLSNITLGSVFDNMDGLSRDDRLRYDTPSFWGFSAATSAVAGNAGDVALFYSSKFPGFKIAGAVAYADPAGNSATVDNQTNGSLSLLADMGLSLTVAAGYQEMKASGRNNPSFYYGKLGYQADFFSCGQTALAIDYGRWDDVAQNNDESDSFSVMGVQNVSRWGTEVYLGYRWYDLERTGRDYDNIDAVLSGARIKF
jgi:predicted porin